MNPGRARLDGGERVGDGEVAVTMAVPVDSDSTTTLLDDTGDEAHDGRRARVDAQGDWVPAGILYVEDRVE